EVVRPGRDPRRVAGKPGGRVSGPPVPRGDDGSAGHPGRGGRAPADRPDNQGAGADRRDGRRYAQTGVAGVAPRGVPAAATEAAVLLLLLLGLGLRAALGS